MNIFLQSTAGMGITASDVLKVTPWTAGGYGLALLVLMIGIVQVFRLYRESAKNERATLIEITKFMPTILDRLDVNDETKTKIAIILNDLPAMKNDIKGLREDVKEVIRHLK